MNAKQGRDNVDPEEFLRALLKISPEDAEKVRKDTTARRSGKDDAEHGDQKNPGDSSPS